MVEMIERIDAFLASLKNDTVWGYIKAAAEKLKALLADMGEDGAVRFVSIIFDSELVITRHKPPAFRRFCVVCLQ